MQNFFESHIFLLILGILSGIGMIISGIIFFKKCTKNSKVESKCIDTYYGVRSKLTKLEYTYKDKIYNAVKIIPFSSKGDIYKIAVNEKKPNLVYSWYDTFMSVELVILGIIFIIVSFVEHL